VAPDDFRPDPTVANRDRLRYELGTPLTVITARAQLLQRQLQRAEAMENGQRDQMLRNVAALLTEVRVLSTRIEVVLVPDAPSPGMPVLPVPTPPADLPD
jgi:hypothetical protein